MLETLKNAWKVAEIRKKLLYTLFMLLVFRLLCFIPTPGVTDSLLENIRTTIDNYSLLGFMQSMTGSDLASYNIMAMGITPYINSSIIMQLLCVAIPKLEELQKQGDEGRKKIAQITRYVTVGLGFVQAVAMTVAMGRGVDDMSFMNYLTIGFCLAAGTALAMWIGERINEKGLGNGISLLIFAGIISRVGPMIINTLAGIINGTESVLTALIVAVVSLAMIVAVVYVDQGERRVPVQYAKRMVGRKMYGGQSTHIPMRVNASGVLPLIFASAIMQFPSTILAIVPIFSDARIWWDTHFYYASWGYQLIFALLIIGFTFFYNTISFNPIEMSKNLQQNGGMIPGIRQGRPTSDYLARISRRITLFGALFLAVLAVVPTLLAASAGVSIAFGASSLLIAVSVALETTRQLESQMLMRHYRGFLK